MTKPQTQLDFEQQQWAAASSFLLLSSPKKKKDARCVVFTSSVFRFDFDQQARWASSLSKQRTTHHPYEIHRSWHIWDTRQWNTIWDTYHLPWIPTNMGLLSKKNKKVPKDARCVCVFPSVFRFDFDQQFEFVKSIDCPNRIWAEKKSMKYVTS